MLSPWRHIQNSCHYHVKGLSFVMAWEMADGSALQYNNNVDAASHVAAGSLLFYSLQCIKVFLVFN